MERAKQETQKTHEDVTLNKRDGSDLGVNGVATNVVVEVWARTVRHDNVDG